MAADLSSRLRKEFGFAEFDHVCLDWKPFTPWRLPSDCPEDQRRVRILTAHNLKVAVLLDSNAAGDNAASQDTLVHSPGAKGILRTKNYVDGVSKPEIEDMLSTTLPIIARDELGIAVVQTALERRQQPLVDMLTTADRGFSKYKLAKAFLRWSREHSASDLTAEERGWWQKLIAGINSVLK